MSYTPPASTSVGFIFEGSSVLIPPGSDAVNFTFAPTAAATPTIDVVATVAVAAAQSVAHGTHLAGIGTVVVTAEMSLEHTAVDVDITLVASVPVLAASEVAHGVAGDGVAQVPVSAAVSADHGVSVAAMAAVPVLALQDIAHGVALDGVASITTSAALSLTHERYELRGEVRLSGVLVNRRVRAYLRASGAMLGEADTVIGKFKVPTGFAPVECYITPIDLASDATDWLPPTANRITSVLAMDTA